jgi:gluconolactonase
VIHVSGLSVPEGPAVLPDGSWLVVEMGPDRGCVTHLPAGGGRRELARTGRPNGLAVDCEGVIWVAESQRPALLRMTPDGACETVLDRCGEDPFLFPNDLCFGPDGMLYLTDSGIRYPDWAPGGEVRDDYAAAPIDGRLYRIDPQTRDIVQLDTGLRFANGLAFGPDDRSLYVAETVTGDVVRYAWSPDGVGEREHFGNVLGPAAAGSGVRGPDGMAFSAGGDLYVAVFGQGDVTVLGPDGSVRRRIRTAGRKPTNVAFGLPGDQRIYVTEDELGSMEVFDAGTGGLPLHDGTASANARSQR